MNAVRYVMTWFAMLLVAMANGALRDFTYGRHLSELHAHQLSSLTGMALLGVVMWWFVRRWPPDSGRNALAIGFFWMALTLAFEFLFFHYVGGHPWAELIDNYKLLQGRIWVLVLAWVALAPYLFHRCGRTAVAR